MTNKLIIFGGGGFIGSTYYLEYHQRFDEIIIIDWFKEPTHSDSYLKTRLKDQLKPNTILIECNIFEIEEYQQHLLDASHILILNADTGTGSSFSSPYHSTNFNSNILSFLIEKIRKYHQNLKLLTIIFTSSRAVYGEGFWLCPTHGRVEISRGEYLISKKLQCPRCSVRLNLAGTPEGTTTQPLSVYGANKLFSEKLLELLFKNEVKKLIILRPQNVYGAGQSRKNPYTGLINWFSESLIQNQDLEIYEHGLIQRDFVEVRDVARAINKSIFEYEESFNVFNVGSGTPTTLIELAEILKELFNSKSKIRITGKFRNGDVLGALSSNENISDGLNFKAGISLSEGLEHYSEWFLNS